MLDLKIKRFTVTLFLHEDAEEQKLLEELTQALGDGMLQNTEELTAVYTFGVETQKNVVDDPQTADFLS